MRRINFARAVDVQAAASNSSVCECCSNAVATEVYDGDQLCGGCAYAARAQDAQQDTSK